MAGTINIEEKTRLLKKRKRVARMKKTIVMTIALWMIGSLLAIVFLTLKIASLQKQITIILDARVVREEQTASSTEILDEIPFLTVDNAENLAQEGDIPMVYLTFDDGPSASSNAILDILDDYGVKATFFCIGQEDEASAEVYKRIVDEGHTIAMHSYSHNYSDIYASEESFQNDFNRIRSLIMSRTGVECDFYRFPGGSSNRVANTEMSNFANFLNEQGVVYYDWNVSSGDATSSAFTAEQLVDNVMKDVVKYKTSVVLLHDASNKTATVEALPNLIEALQAEGAMVLPITKDTTVIQHMSVLQ